MLKGDATDEVEAVALLAEEEAARAHDDGWRVGEEGILTRSSKPEKLALRATWVAAMMLAASTLKLARPSSSADVTGRE
jgi:hypothetical protein